MEKLKIHEQPGWCGPACMQVITRDRGMTFSQSELGRMMGTTTEDGTNHIQMFSGAQKLELHPSMLEDATLEILTEFLPENHIIVNWMDGTDEKNDGHYSYLDRIDKDKVHLRDTTMTRQEFNEKWYDFEDGKRVNRWAMIVKK